MKLFKNKVGRPSNADIRRRRIFYACLVLSVALLIGAGFLLTNRYINNTLGAVKKKECLMPYTRRNCYGKKNETIKKVQQMLKKLKHYNGPVNGKFNLATYRAVKKFQKSQKIEQDGKIGPITLKKLAKKAKVKYYVIKFNKKNGSGELNSSYNDQLVVINGIQTKLPSVKLTKSGLVHVGYFAVTKASDGERYYYGGFSPENGGKGSRAYSVSEIGDKKFYSYLYKPGASVSQTGWENGQVITFKAAYCKAGAYYDTSKSKCVYKTTSELDENSPYYLNPEQELILKASVCQESDGSYNSAKAVIDTMMNRVDDTKRFYNYNTLWDVLTAPQQFQAYGADHYKTRIDSEGQLIQSCSNAEQAVDDAITNPSVRSHKYFCFLFTTNSNDSMKIGNVYFSNSCLY